MTDSKLQSPFFWTFYTQCTIQDQGSPTRISAQCFNFVVPLCQTTFFISMYLYRPNLFLYFEVLFSYRSRLYVHIHLSVLQRGRARSVSYLNVDFFSLLRRLSVCLDFLPVFLYKIYRVGSLYNIVVWIALGVCLAQSDLTQCLQYLPTCLLKALTPFHQRSKQSVPYSAHRPSWVEVPRESLDGYSSFLCAFYCDDISLIWTTGWKFTLIPLA